jgi:hypothetical protein
MLVLGPQGAYKVYILRKKPNLIIGNNTKKKKKNYENTVHEQGHMMLSIKKEKI